MTKTIKKDIANLKKIPHPQGRKTAQLTKKLHKINKRQKVKHQNQVKTNLAGEKVLWFKDNLEENCLITPLMVADLVNKYLGRFNDELEQIRIKHSVGNHRNRQHASREDIIKLTMKSESEEYNGCGLEIPDILNPAQLKILRNWNGELKYLQHFNLKRYSKKYLEKECDKYLATNDESNNISEDTTMDN